MRKAAMVVASVGLVIAGFAGGVAWESRRHEIAPRDSIAAASPPSIAPTEPALKPSAPIEQAAPLAPEQREVSVAKTPSSPRSARDLVDELRRLAAKKPPANRNDITRLLEQLIAVGTDEAIGFALELMEDESFDFSGRAETFGELLAKINDPRIAAASRRVLERNLNEGLDSWVSTRGYLLLIARRGDRDAGDFLLSLIRTRPSGQVSNFAALMIGSLTDRSLSVAFLDLVRSKHPESDAIVTGLARWRDPAILDELTRLALQPDTPIDRLDLLGDAVGRNVDSEEFSRFIARYRSATDDRERALSLRVLMQLSKNDRLDAAALAPQSIAVVADALRDSSAELWQIALWAVRDNEAYRVPELLSIVQSLADDTANEKRSREARRTLAELRGH